MGERGCWGAGKSGTAVLGEGPSGGLGVRSKVGVVKPVSGLLPVWEPLGRRANVHLGRASLIVCTFARVGAAKVQVTPVAGGLGALTHNGRCGCARFWPAVSRGSWSADNSLLQG